MQTPEYPPVPPDFGNWLAGFIDGEGCFLIARRTRREGAYPYFSPAMRLAIRADDRPALELIQATTGIGRLYDHAGGGARNPSSAWAVNRKDDCARLVQILDAHPLRAKKAAEYAVWRKAVLLWGTAEYGKRAPTRGCADWAPLEALRLELQGVRHYPPTSS